MVKIVRVGDCGCGVLYACNVTHIPRVGEHLTVTRDEKTPFKVIAVSHILGDDDVYVLVKREKERSIHCEDIDSKEAWSIIHDLA